MKSKDLVSGLPTIKFQDNRLCDACVKGKQIKSSFNSKDIISTKNPLDVLHMDLFGPFRVASLAGNLYARFENGCYIKSIRSDHGGEFQNARFERFCEKHGISHSFSAPRTPQQNGVVERKNRSLEELARTMLNESKLPMYFWADVVRIAAYVLNKTLIRPILNTI